MRRAQKITAVVSVLIVLVLAVVLGIFLWTEERKAREEGDTLETVESDGQEPEGGSEEAGEDGTDSDGSKEEETPGTGEDGEAVSGQEPEEPQEPQEPEEPQEPQEPEISDVNMMFTGDVMLGSSVLANYDSAGLDGILSEYLQTELLQADLTVINEEFPFSSRGTPMPDKTYTFRVDKSYLSVFQEMGVDVVSLANNHALDYGEEALLDTFDALDEVGIPYAGAGADKERAEEAIFFERGGRTIGVLAASRVIPVVEWNIENRQPGLFCTYDSTALEAAIARTRPLCDYLIIYVHWGIERQDYPEEYQRTLAEAYIDAGADLVVGSHPHVPQGIEYYNGKPIVYSLGNFIFNPNMVATYALKVLWSVDGQAQLQVIPVKTDNALTADLIGEAKQEMLRYVENISFDVSIDENGMVTAAQ